MPGELLGRTRIVTIEQRLHFVGIFAKLREMLMERGPAIEPHTPREAAEVDGAA